MIREISNEKIRELLKTAAKSERKRTHLLMHEGPEAAIHRMCIAAMPETVFKPQRHPGKFELLILLCGEAVMHLYHADGSEFQSIRLSADGEGLRVLELPDTCFHRMEVVKPTVFFEVKPGPLMPSEELN